MNVLIVNGGIAYFNLFKELGFTPVEEVKDAQLVCFTGGEDVTPELYGQKKHHSTYNSVARDEYETRVFAQCITNDIPMVGICRGAQFLNVMNGGEMYQDVGKHAVYQGHEIIDVLTDERIHVTSTHHQMMKPGNDSVLIAYAELAGFREWYDGDKLRADISDKDIEVVGYPKTRCLCFQPHPEFNLPNAGHRDMRAYFAGLVRELLEAQEA